MPQKSKRRSRVKIDAGDVVCTYTSEGGYRCTTKVSGKGGETCQEHVGGSNDWIMLPSPSPALTEVAAQPFWGMQSQEYPMVYVPTSQPQTPSQPAAPAVAGPPPPPPGPPKPVRVFHIDPSIESIEMPDVLGGINPTVVSTPVSTHIVSTVVLPPPLIPGTPPPPPITPAISLPPLGLPTPDPVPQPYPIPSSGSSPTYPKPTSFPQDEIELSEPNPVIDLIGLLLQGINEPKAGKTPNDAFYIGLRKKFDSSGNMVVDKFTDVGPIPYSSGTHSVHYYVPSDLGKLYDRAFALTKDDIPPLILLKGLYNDTSMDPDMRALGDVRFLQSIKKFEGALFQIASNFNALEQTAPDKYPGALKNYFGDNTQGPSAALGAFAALVYRRYLSFDPATASPSNPVTYKNYPGKFFKDDVPGVYSGAKMTPGGWLDISGAVPDPQLQAAASSKAMLGAVMAAQGFGMVGVRDCSSMIHIGALSGKVRLALKTEMKISQALCATIDTTYKTAEIGARMFSWVLTTVFACYYNTLRYAMEIGATKVVLTLMGGGTFGIAGDHIFECLVLAMKFVALERPLFKNVKIYVALWDSNEATSRTFFTTTVNSDTHMGGLFRVNKIEVDRSDDIPI